MLPSYLTPKSIWSYNPLPTGCVLYLPLWHPNLSGPVFKSIDPYGYTCTPTGTTWTSTGRYLNGTSETMTISDHTGLNFGTGDFSILAWISADADAVLSRIVSKQHTAWYFLRFLTTGITCDIKDSDADTATATSAVVDLRGAGFAHIGVTCDRDSATGFQTFISGVASGAAVDPTGANNSLDGTEPLMVGSFSATGEEFKGTIGEVLMYNRHLSAIDILYHYNKTKFRYT